MSVQLLDKTRKINKLLHNNNSSKVVFNDICDVLTDILSSNILVISKKGKVLGVGKLDNIEPIAELIDEPAIDLGIIVALVSSMQNRQIKDDVIILGEVGLTGEVRTINFLEKRLIEAEKMGFQTAVVPQGNLKREQHYPLEVRGVRNVSEALQVILGGA